MDDRTTVIEVRNCIDKLDDGRTCGRPFNITKGNKQFYETKGMPLPKRCETCRIRRRSSIKGPIQLPIK